MASGRALYSFVMDRAGAGPRRALEDLDPYVIEVARALHGAGGRACLVGGWVREWLASRFRLPRGQEIDLEVYDLTPERLVAVLRRLGRVNLVGESFAVYKLRPKGATSLRLPYLDVSLPRRDQRTGRGHRGFLIEGD